MLNMIGFSQLNSFEAWTLFFVALALCLIAGYVLDLITNHIGFGIFGNAVVSMLGLFVGLYMYRNYMGELSMARVPIIMGFASASVMMHMFVLIFLRRALKL